MLHGQTKLLVRTNQLRLGLSSLGSLPEKRENNQGLSENKYDTGDNVSSVDFPEAELSMEHDATGRQVANFHPPAL